MWACNRQRRARGCTSHVHAIASVASVSQIYFSTVDNQHKTKAAVRVHIIFRRGAELGSDLYTSEEPAGPKRVQLDLQTQTPSDTDQQPYHRGMLGSTKKRWTAPPPIPLNGGAWGWWWERKRTRETWSKMATDHTWSFGVQCMNTYVQVHDTFTQWLPLLQFPKSIIVQLISSTRQRLPHGCISFLGVEFQQHQTYRQSTSRSENSPKTNRSMEAPSL